MIVREGWLLKRGEHIKNWRARYFILVDDGSLLGYKQKPPQGLFRDYAPTNNFTVKGCHIVKVESPTHFIFVIRGLNSEQEIERNFSAGNHHDRDGWCSAIAETAFRLMNRQLPNQLQDCDMLDTSVLSIADLHQQQQQHTSNNNNNNNNDPLMSTSSQQRQHQPHLQTHQQQQQQLHSSHNTHRQNYNNHHHLSANSAAAHEHINAISICRNTTNTTETMSINNNKNKHNNDEDKTIVIDDLKDPSNTKKMSLDDFNPIKLIGRGSWGKVMLSREKSTGCLYAIKILKKQVIISQDEVGHTLTESRVLRTTTHPFLIALKYSFRDGERLCFVLEFAGGGELFYHLSQERVFTEEKSRFYGAEIVSALGYLHAHDIIYRDLKLENLLLGRDGHIKIADFGLCKDKITYNDTTRTFCGTPEYLSPEVIEDFNYGRAVDWWGLGVLLYEMMCGGLPFNNRSTDQLFQEILMKEVTFPPTLTIEAKSFLNGLLIKNPTKRLGGGPEDAQEIQVHPFFRGLNWQDLYDKKIPPPFVPQVESDIDTKYFDRQFTTEPPNLTPIDRPMNHPSEVDASYFNQFSFTAAGSALSQQQLSSHFN